MNDEQRFFDLASLIVKNKYEYNVGSQMNEVINSLVADLGWTRFTFLVASEEFDALFATVENIYISSLTETLSNELDERKVNFEKLYKNDKTQS